MEKEIIVVGALLLFGAILVPAIGASFADAPKGTQTVDNESIEISTTEWTSVSRSGTAESFYDNETVYYNGSLVSETEYQWDASDGELRAEPGGDLENASVVSITYAYEVADDWLEAEGILRVVFFFIAGLVLIAGGLMLLVPIFSIVDAAGGGGGR